MFWNIFLEKVEGLLYYIKQKQPVQFLKAHRAFSKQTTDHTAQLKTQTLYITGIVYNNANIGNLTLSSHLQSD